MKRFARRTLVTAAFVLATSPAAAAPKAMINYFQPMPIVGKLSTTVWGASTVGARDPANGLEDSGANGGVGPQQQTNFYWDGKILFGNDGKYHLYATHWLHRDGFGPPGGGSTGWKNSIPMESISDSVMGPYVSQGNCYTKNLEGNDMGHNLTALIAPTGTSPYTLSVGEIVPGQMFSSSSPNGPWTSLGLSQTTTNGHNGCGNTSSNFAFTVGPDKRFWATSRAGCVMDSDQVLGPYKIETNSVLPNLENSDNKDAEDECIWYSGGYYHILFNYWPVQRAYHIMSKDGITNWTSTGLAYQAAQSPRNANSNWLRYTDGTVNVWHNMERVGVVVANGHPTHFTFAVTDVNKNVTGVSQGGSKILVVPFNGVNSIATTATRLPATKSRRAGTRAGPAASTEGRVAVEGAQGVVEVLAVAQAASVARTAAVGRAVARSVAVPSPLVAQSAAEARAQRPAQWGAQYPAAALEQRVAIRWQAEEVWVHWAGPEVQLALVDRVATNRALADREPADQEPADQEPADRAATPKAAILAPAVPRLPAGARRPAVRAASATLPVRLGHCFSSDLSRPWLVFAGQEVVVVLYRKLSGRLRPSTYDSALSILELPAP
jgi:hypothetical protein